MHGITCKGSNTGILQAIVTGGRQTDRIFEWYKGNTLVCSCSTGIYSGANAGDYYVKIIDSIPDENHEYETEAQSEDYSLTEPDKLLTATYNVTSTSALDATDGKVTVVASGGISPYTYLWEHDNSTGETLSNIAARDEPYRVTVTDANANACVKPFDTYAAYYPVSVAVSQTKTVSCYGASDAILKANLTGGIKNGCDYIWYKIDEDSGEEIFLGTAINNNTWTVGAGTYRVEISDVMDSTAVSETFIVTQPDSLIADYEITLPSAHDASDGEISILASGGTPPYSYQWVYDNHTGRVFSGIPARRVPYSVIVSDSQGCSLTLNPRVIYPLEVEISVVDSILCFGSSNGQLAATPTGGIAGYTLEWYSIVDGEEHQLTTPNFYFLRDVVAGTYRVKATDDEDNIAFSNDFVFNSPEPLELDAIPTVPSSETALDGSIEIVASGGTSPYEYLWFALNYSGAVISGLPAGYTPYEVVVRDKRGCTESMLARLIIPLKVSLAVKDSISCYGHSDGSLQATVSGGLSETEKKHRWYRMENGVYQSVEGSTDSLSGLNEGQYKIVVINTIVAGEDSLVAEKEIVFNSPKLLRGSHIITPPTAYNAADGKVNLTILGGTAPYAYLWEHDLSTAGSRTDLPARDTPYKITVVDSRHCSTELFPRVIYPLAVKVTVVDSISCFGRSDGRLKATAVGGVGLDYRYQWYKTVNGSAIRLTGETSATLSSVGQGLYHVVATDIENNTALSDKLNFDAPDLL